MRTSVRILYVLAALLLLPIANFVPDFLVPSLAKALDDDNRVVNREAALALLHCGKLAISAVPNLASRLAQCDDTAWLSAEALGNMGPEARPALPQLLEALRSGCGITREFAARALARLGDDDSVRHALEVASHDTDRSVARAAAEALAHMPKGADGSC